MKRSLALAVGNAAAIAMLAAWGVSSNEWYVQAVGGPPDIQQVLTWCLVLLNAPAFLFSVAVTPLLRLDPWHELLAQNLMWAFATIPMWLIYPRLLRPAHGPVRAISLACALAATAGAAWAFAVAWRQGHDPHHSCWDVIQLVSMLLGLAVLAAGPGLRSAGFEKRPS